MDTITRSGPSTQITIEVVEPALAQLLDANDAEDWPDLVRRAVAVGAHTLLTAGVAVDLGDVDATVRRVLAETAADAERRVAELLEAGRTTLAEQLDPAHRDSLLGRALDDFDNWRTVTLAGLDPQEDGSSAAVLLDRLTEQLGDFDERLRTSLDPSADGSGFAALAAQMDVLFRELFAQLGRNQGREEEAAVGTAKGVDFEDTVESRLRVIAKNLGGSYVERTSRSQGALGSDAIVGDFVMTLASGRKIVIEAKHQQRVGLHGPNGILVELERASANRGCHAAVCVSALDAFPSEVGPLGRYGDALLVVDDGSGDLLEPALRWAAAIADQQRDADGIDADAVAAALDRILSKARNLSDAKRALTEIGKSVTQVQDSLDGLRRDLVDTVEDAVAAMRPPTAVEAA